MIWIICIFTLFLNSCDQKPQESHYTEVVVQAPQTTVPTMPVVQAAPDQAASVDPHAGLDISAMSS